MLKVAGISSNKGPQRKPREAPVEVKMESLVKKEAEEPSDPKSILNATKQLQQNIMRQRESKPIEQSEVIGNP